MVKPVVSGSWCGALLVAIWALAFYSSAYDALSTWLTGSVGEPMAGDARTQWAEVPRLCGIAVLGVGSVVAVRWWWRRSGRQERPLDPGAGVLVAVGAYLTVHLFAAVIRALVFGSEETTTWSSAVFEVPVLHVVTALGAGLVEEPLLAVLPVLLLDGRVRWWWIVLASGGVRAVLHSYYGWSGLVWAAIWGSGAVLVYLAFRRVWPLIIGHAISNLSAVAVLWPDSVDPGVFGMVLVATWFGAALAFFCHFRYGWAARVRVGPGGGVAETLSESVIVAPVVNEDSGGEREHRDPGDDGAELGRR